MFPRRAQVTLLVLESDQIKAQSFDVSGFAEVVVMANSTRQNVLETALWARGRPFDIVFYPQVHCGYPLPRQAPRGATFFMS